MNSPKWRLETQYAQRTLFENEAREAGASFVICDLMITIYDCYISTMKNALTITGLVLIILGGLFLVDGILPTRSHNPNPSILEIILGLGLGFLGWFIRGSSTFVMGKRGGICFSGVAYDTGKSVSTDIGAG